MKFCDKPACTQETPCTDCQGVLSFYRTSFDKVDFAYRDAMGRSFASATQVLGVGQTVSVMTEERMVSYMNAFEAKLQTNLEKAMQEMFEFQLKANEERAAASAKAKAEEEARVVKAAADAAAAAALLASTPPPEPGDDEPILGGAKKGKARKTKKPALLAATQDQGMPEIEITELRRMASTNVLTGSASVSPQIQSVVQEAPKVIENGTGVSVLHDHGVHTPPKVNGNTPKISS